LKKGLLAKILNEIARNLENKYEVEDFRKRLEHYYNLEPEEISKLTELYEKLLSLEKEGKNGVWISIIRNSFAPLFIGKFDYVFEDLKE